jgi:hypothetical protein
MDYVCFTNRDKAIIQRNSSGGHIAIDDRGLYFWFNPVYTISKIMVHKALSGCNAKFI